MSIWIVSVICRRQSGFFLHLLMNSSTNLTILSCLISSGSVARLSVPRPSLTLEFVFKSKPSIHPLNCLSIKDQASVKGWNQSQLTSGKRKGYSLGHKQPTTYVQVTVARWLHFLLFSFLYDFIFDLQRSKICICFFRLRRKNPFRCSFFFFFFCLDFGTIIKPMYSCFGSYRAHKVLKCDFFNHVHTNKFSCGNKLISVWGLCSEDHEVKIKLEFSPFIRWLCASEIVRDA